MVVNMLATYVHIYMTATSDLHIRPLIWMSLSRATFKSVSEEDFTEKLSAIKIFLISCKFL